MVVVLGGVPRAVSRGAGRAGASPRRRGAQARRVSRRSGDGVRGAGLRDATVPRAPRGATAAGLRDGDGRASNHGRSGVHRSRHRPVGSRIRLAAQRAARPHEHDGAGICAHGHAPSVAVDVVGAVLECRPRGERRGDRGADAHRARRARPRDPPERRGARARGVRVEGQAPRDRSPARATTSSRSRASARLRTSRRRWMRSSRGSRSASHDRQGPRRGRVSLGERPHAYARGGGGARSRVGSGRRRDGRPPVARRGSDARARGARRRGRDRLRMSDVHGQRVGAVQGVHGLDERGLGAAGLARQAGGRVHALGGAERRQAGDADAARGLRGAARHGVGRARAAADVCGGGERRRRSRIVSAVTSARWRSRDRAEACCRRAT